MNEKIKSYRSRISILLMLIIVLSLSIASISIYRTGDLIDGCLIFLLFVFMALICSGMRYIVSENYIYCKLWFIPLAAIDINNIGLIKRSYNPLSSPAASLKRLAIYSSINSAIPFVLISPIKEREFIDDLLSTNPHIRVSISEVKTLWHFWDWDI